ncbi:MAG: acetate--CoA ligase family protein, partial [Candidatus Nanohaloarchaea archaeon]
MLDDLFLPEKVAVVGASREEGKTGHEVFDNLLHDFEGEVVPVNPNADEVHGVEAEDSVPGDTDMAVIAVPSKIVPEIMDDLAAKNVSAAIIISAGFSETGNEDLEKEVLEKAEDNDIALLGPNVLGLINTENSMNASFASKMPSPGDISFMSQSGAFCTAILDYAKAEHLGFRHFVSLGNKAMLNEVDFLKKWREDETEVILSYTEGIENGREFMEEARKTARHKPIVVVKSGRTEKGGEAASTHTGSIAGSYQAYEAAFRKAGVIEAESNRELVDFGRAFSYQDLPEGKNVAVVTNAGGPGVVTADEISEHGLELAEFSPKTEEKLEEFMPEEASIHNPLDVIGDAGHERYKKALETVSDEENADSVLVLLTPQANTEIEKTAKTIVKASEETDKPVFACFLGERDVSAGVDILEEGGVPDFRDPVDAVKTLRSMNQYRRFLEEEETFVEVEHDEEKVSEAMEDVSRYENAEKLLEAYGFDFPLTKVAETPREAEEAASKVGYPVVLKIDSPDISHKTDVDGIRAGLESRQEVNQGYQEIVDSVYDNRPGAEIEGVQVQEEMDGLEVALGMQRDPQFGPMVMAGLGGIYIEALHDVSFGVAPISEEEAEEMIEELRSHELFEGVRGEEHSMEPVKEAIIRLGELALDNENIRSIDINPLILKQKSAYVADIEIDLEK